MKKSDTIGELAKALAKVQAELRPVLKDNQVKYNKVSYTFADLQSVIFSAKQLMTENGLSFVQGAREVLGQQVVVEMTLLHESGEWIESEVAVPLDVKLLGAQAAGSAISYGRRYLFTAMLGMVTDDDDDGYRASSSTEVNASQPVEAVGSKSNPTKATGLATVNGSKVEVVEQKGRKAYEASASDAIRGEIQKSYNFFLMTNTEKVLEAYDKIPNFEKKVNALYLSYKQIVAKDPAISDIEAVIHRRFKSFELLVMGVNEVKPLFKNELADNADIQSLVNLATNSQVKIAPGDLIKKALVELGYDEPIGASALTKTMVAEAYGYIKKHLANIFEAEADPLSESAKLLEGVKT